MRTVLELAPLAVLVAAALAAASARADDLKSAAGTSPWVADFDKAAARAKSEKKDLLVDFTGSDWCGWCVQLNKEVFSQADFLDAAQKQYVLVALDFPRGEQAKAKVPDKARNDALQQKYAVGGFPTVLLMTPEGEVFGRTGYREGGAAKYVEHLAALRAAGLPALTNAKEFAAAVASAKDADRPAAYEKAVAALAALDPGAPGSGLLAAPVMQAYGSDPENKTGLRVRAAKALLSSGQADDAVVAAASSLDPKNAAGLLELAIFARTQRVSTLEQVKAAVKEVDDLVAGPGVKDAKLGRRLFVETMWFNHEHLKDAEKAKAYAKRVRDAGYGANEERLKELVDRILGDAK